MAKKTNLSLLILCTILCQGIASLSDNITTDSLDLLVRKKRLIDSSSNRNRPRLEDVPYAVQIRQHGLHVCGGSILTAHVILTAANCVGDVFGYTVVAGTVSARSGGSIHFVNGILRHPNHNPDSFDNNIALLSILEPILLDQGLNHRIQIYESHDPHLPPNTLVTTSGWGLILKPDSSIGCFNRRNERTTLPGELRSISLPTISIPECRNRNPNAPWISNQLICTYHAEKRCSAGDTGNPLVFGGRLVGVLSWYRRDGSDVFVNVAIPEYRNWIITHMNHIPPLAGVPMQPFHPAMGNEPLRPNQCSKIYPCHD